jgi:cell division protein FtsB
VAWNGTVLVLQFKRGSTLHEKVKKLERELETLYEERDAIVEKVKDQVYRSRDILKGIHRADLRKLGDWGFDVDN